jgi:hypothetical protein
MHDPRSALAIAVPDALHRLVPRMDKPFSDMLIYNRERELVTEAAKNGWTPRMLGWAHDSSGAYFQMLIAGGAASMLVP